MRNRLLLFNIFLFCLSGLSHLCAEPEKTLLLEEVATEKSVTKQLFDRSQLPEGFEFSHDYLEKYFPKVFVVRDFFLRMTADAVEKALDAIVTMLAFDPSLYFVNQDQPFKISHYWEHVIDQLSWMSEFLESARVDQVTGRVIEKSKNHDLYPYRFMDQEISDTPLLVTKLTENKQGAYYQFYALAFDYLKKMFNEGILLPDIHQAMNYYVELEFVTEKLRGSMYEAEYQEHLSEARDLMNLLKQKLGVKDDALEAGGTRRRMRSRIGFGL